MSQSKTIALWLFICCGMVFLMVVIGGLTRLTESGLSITDWRPVTGIIPPLSEQHWLEEFSKYQQSPEYQKINTSMDMEGFKNIFWLEYIHRLLGRLTGFVFFLPLIYFAFKKKISNPLLLRLLAILLLGAAQGLAGWLMVRSGLKDRPEVSQYWLAFHLAMAAIIFALLLWQGLSLWYGRQKVKKIPKNIQILSIIIPVVVFLQMIAGAFVAGLDAGLIYNTFPDMNGEWVPEGMWVLEPWYRNPFENVTLVQFRHRMLAYVLVIIIIGFWAFSRRIQLTKRINYAIRLLLLCMGVQFTLGVLTLLHQVPVVLASLHQAMAILLFANALYITHAIGIKKPK